VVVKTQKTKKSETDSVARWRRRKGREKKGKESEEGIKDKHTSVTSRVDIVSLSHHVVGKDETDSVVNDSGSELVGCHQERGDGETRSIGTL
jgi:hypothetical protein